MPEILRLVGIAKIQIVGHRERFRARAREIASGFGDRNFRAFARIERAVERITITGGRQNFVRITNEINRGVRTRLDQRAGAHGVIVLAINPVLGRDRWIAQQFTKRFDHGFRGFR